MMRGTTSTVGIGSTLVSGKLSVGGLYGTEAYSVPSVTANIIARFSDTVNESSGGLDFEQVGGVIIVKSAINGTGAIGFATRTSYANYERMRINNDGSITMINVYSDTVGSTNRDLYIDNTGKLGYVSSSIRYKVNVNLLGDIDWIYDLSPVEFDYIASQGGGHSWGLIAEDVDKIQPALVSYEKGEPETVSYGQLVVPLLKCVQEQQKQIADLTKRIEKLEINR